MMLGMLSVSNMHNSYTPVSLNANRPDLAGTAAVACSVRPETMRAAFDTVFITFRSVPPVLRLFKMVFTSVGHPTSSRRAQ